MKSLRKASRLLETLSEAPKGLALSELAQCLGEPKPSTHRILQSLMEEGFVAQEAERGVYRLGPQVLSLSRAFLSKRELVDHAMPHLREVADGTGETTFLTERVGDRAVCVAIVQGTHRLRFFIEVGSEMPLNASASAQAIFAYMDLSAIDRLISSQEFTQYTSKTALTHESVKTALKRVQDRGYAICEGELDEGSFAVAAPIWRADASVVGSVGLVAPEGRVAEVGQERLLASVREAARGISRELV